MNLRSIQTPLAAIGLLTVAGLAPSAGAEVYFREDFRNYADSAPGVSADNGMTVGNDPIWAKAAELNVRATKNGNVFIKPMAAPELAAFDLCFSFRFMNATAPTEARGDEPAKPGVPGVFHVVLRNVTGKTVSVPFSSDGAGGGSYPSNPFMANRQWEETALKMSGGIVDIYVTRDRAFERVASVPFAGPLTEVNFRASADKHFSLRNIVLRDPEPLTGHPVEKHFADFRSLSQPIAGARTATAGATATLTPAPRAGIRFRLGPGDEPASMSVNWSDGASDTYPFALASQRHRLRASMAGKPKGATVDLPDAAIEIGQRARLARQFVRPHLKMYVSTYDAEPQCIDIVRDWSRLPSASGHPLDVDFEALPDGGVRMFLDGSYATKLSKDGARLRNVVFTFAAGVRYAVKRDLAAGVDMARYTIIDLAANPRAKAFADATPSIEPGRRVVERVPLGVVSGMDSADVAICKQGKGNWALEVEEYLGRSPRDGFPSAIHYRLPAAPYVRAHVLCALDPDPKKDAFLTVRMGYYVGNGSGGNMLGDTKIEVKDGKVPDNFKQVGTLALPGGGSVPLYYADLPLNLGRILDIAARKDYLDFELIGKGWINFEQMDRSMKPDPHSDSAFNIFAVTLEKAPVSMDFRQTQPANVFTVDEQVRKTTAVLTAVAPDADGVLRWLARDQDGGEAFHGTKKFLLAKAGDTAELDIGLEKAAVGFYNLDIELEDVRGVRLISHAASFAILPKDERTLGKYKSPFATWWFSAHGSPAALDLGGPIMRKAGIRKASWNKLTPEAMEEYNITNCGNLMCPGMRDFDAKSGTFKPKMVPDPDNPGKKKELSGEEAFVRKIGKSIAANPTADHIMIWHESAPGYGIPEELLGLEVPEPTDRDKTLAAYVNESGRIIRKHFPKLTIQIGNSSASIGAATRPLRAGADPQYYDRIGIETPSQVIPPERLQEVGLQGMIISQEIASKLAKRKVLLNGAREFTYRCERDMGEQQQAEWYMRDVLISLSQDFFLISPGILFDCLNGYYNGLWGGSGMLRRAPYCYPKRAYAAYAVLTSVFDGVTCSRQIPTGSTTVYAMEFKRADGRFVTALWAARGEAVFTVECPSAVEVTSMYGRKSRVPAGTGTAEAGTSPAYLVSPDPLASVSISGRSFRKAGALAAKAQIAAALEDAAALTLAPDPAIESTHHKFLPIMKRSDFTLSQVVDEEKGACVEVALDISKNTGTSKYVTEYTTVRLKEPARVPGNPEVVGVWVKGNSNWGQIRFEIEDANGEVFKNLSTGSSWGCDIMDWPGNLAVNFDGWCYVYQTLFPTTLVNDHSPGPHSEQWVSEGGDKVIDLPIKIRAITVGMNRTKLDLLDFKPATPTIRLRDVSGCGERQ